MQEAPPPADVVSGPLVINWLHSQRDARGRSLG
jgi:hypothetical protein